VAEVIYNRIPTSFMAKNVVERLAVMNVQELCRLHVELVHRTYKEGLFNETHIPMIVDLIKDESCEQWREVR